MDYARIFSLGNKMLPKSKRPGFFRGKFVPEDEPKRDPGFWRWDEYPLSSGSGCRVLFQDWDGKVVGDAVLAKEPIRDGQHWWMCFRPKSIRWFDAPLTEAQVRGIWCTAWRQVGRGINETLGKEATLTLRHNRNRWYLDAGNLDDWDKLVDNPTRLPGGAPSDDDTRQALEKSGYPLEVKLFKRLQDRNFDPTIGHRFTVAETSIEIDLLARKSTQSHTDDTGDTPRTTRAQLLAMMEVKNLPTDIRMVGVRSTEGPSQMANRGIRAKMEGFPSWHAHRDVPDGRNTLTQLLVADGGLGDAFDRLDAPLCVHWAKVYFKREGNNFLPWACGDDNWREQLVRLVQVSESILRNHTQHQLEFQLTHGNSLLWVTFHVLALVVQTPHALGLYDPDTGELSAHDWITYRRVFDVGRGELTTRVVDIVTADKGLDLLLDAIEGVATAMDARLGREVRTLAEAADAQLDHWRERSLQHEVASIDTLGIFDGR